MALAGSRPVVALESITKTNGVGCDTRHSHCHRSFTRKQILLNITTQISWQENNSKCGDNIEQTSTQSYGLSGPVYCKPPHQNKTIVVMQYGTDLHCRREGVRCVWRGWRGSASLSCSPPPRPGSAGSSRWRARRRCSSVWSVLCWPALLRTSHLKLENSNYFWLLVKM